LLVLIVVVSVIGSIFSNGDEPQVQTVSSSSGGRVSSSPVATATARPRVAGIGDAVTTANWRITVPATPIRTDAVGSGFLGETTQATFVVVEIEITNIGDDGSTFSDWQVSLFDGLDREFDPADYSTQAAVGGGFFLEQTNPGITRSGFVVFEVPARSINLTLEIRGALFSPSARISLGGVK
jgi:hypothetical protein